jgi:hypothetical protein
MCTRYGDGVGPRPRPWACRLARLALLCHTHNYIGMHKQGVILLLISEQYIQDARTHLHLKLSIKGTHVTLTMTSRSRLELQLTKMTILCIPNNTSYCYFEEVTLF